MYSIVEEGSDLETGFESMEDAVDKAKEWARHRIKEGPVIDGLLNTDYAELFINDETTDKNVVRVKLDVMMSVTYFGKTVMAINREGLNFVVKTIPGTDERYSVIINGKKRGEIIRHEGEWVNQIYNVGENFDLGDSSLEEAALDFFQCFVAEPDLLNY